ncbi:hypothetical protein AJE_09379 [Alishewanella jeotgali KCTC 22429]|uniref:Uncharacterized protein n=1 Tax=Alishewanella jeotgali KCTC 22429 TaxID=1129374 RepID=H3ZEU1_9ALTE|nr:hypothetical protein AJE_09379 [Alishewanella jeotgali KCTC 22429]
MMKIALNSAWIKTTAQPMKQRKLQVFSTFQQPLNSSSDTLVMRWPMQVRYKVLEVYTAIASNTNKGKEY